MKNARVSRRSEKLGASPWEGAPGTAYVEATTKNARVSLGPGVCQKITKKTIGVNKPLGVQSNGYGGADRGRSPEFESRVTRN